MALNRRVYDDIPHVPKRDVKPRAGPRQYKAILVYNPAALEQVHQALIHTYNMNLQQLLIVRTAWKA